MSASPSQQLQQFTAAMTALRREVGRVIIGQGPLIDGVLTCVVCGGHALLEGVPGLGKTALVRAVAEGTGLSFSRIQFTPDLMPTDIVGTDIFLTTGERRFEFDQGPVFANIVLADEINRATPKTQSALLQAMQEGSVSVGKQTHALPDPFIVMATQNPLDMEGTYPLPEAQLDRFMLKLHVPFPARDELLAILTQTTGGQGASPQAVLSTEDIRALRATVREVAVAPHVLERIVSLIEATHPDRERAPASIRNYVACGASPRGAQACLLAAKARALMDGRLHVDIRDVRAVAHDALRHRVQLNFEAEADGRAVETLLQECIEQECKEAR